MVLIAARLGKAKKWGSCSCADAATNYFKARVATRDSPQALWMKFGPKRTA